MVNKPPLHNNYEELKALIESDTNKELECRKYLQYVKDILFRETPSNYQYVETEYRGNSGDSDYIISGTIKDESGAFECVRAYIWELKAPQCFVFEKDNENRLRPTKELIQAENQLLHYFDEQKGSDQFRNDFKITHPDHVRMGGIIIGSSRTLVNGDFEEQKKIKLFEKTKSIREKYFYRGCDIRLLTWETILNQLRPPQISLCAHEYTAGVIEKISLTPWNDFIINIGQPKSPEQ